MSNFDPSDERGGDQIALLVTVYVVDDQDLVRTRLVELLDHADDILVVGSARDPSTAIDEIADVRPMVAVVDGYFPGHEDGLFVCRTLHAVVPDVAVVVVTAGIGVTWGPVEARAAGAAAYLVKQLRDFPIVDVITRVAAGERLVGL